MMRRAQVSTWRIAALVASLVTVIVVTKVLLGPTATAIATFGVTVIMFAFVWRHRAERKPPES